MTVRLYLDEDAQRKSFVQTLRQADIDLVTVSEVDRVGYSDAEQLAWAAQERRAIYTFNVRDFCQLHSEYLARGAAHAGIIVAPRQDYSIGQQLRAVQNLLQITSAETVINQLIFLSNYF